MRGSGFARRLIAEIQRDAIGNKASAASLEGQSLQDLS
jgi:hypothetical protein